MMTSEEEHKAALFVRREFGVNQSSLISMLREKRILSDNLIVNLHDVPTNEQVEELMDLRMEEAEINARLSQPFFADEMRQEKYAELEEVLVLIDGLEEIGACEKEINQWWTVSDWMADKLEEKGEVILRSDYGTWWGRLEGGQGLVLDSPIKEIMIDLEIIENRGRQS